MSLFEALAKERRSRAIREQEALSNAALNNERVTRERVTMLEVQLADAEKRLAWLEKAVPADPKSLKGRLAWLLFA